MYKNSSRDEIANVNLFTTISHTYFKIPKSTPFSSSSTSFWYQFLLVRAGREGQIRLHGNGRHFMCRSTWPFPIWPFPSWLLSTFPLSSLLPLLSIPARKSKNWYQIEVDEELKGVDSTDTERRKKRSVILREDDVGGRARVTTDEE